MTLALMSIHDRVTVLVLGKHQTAQLRPVKVGIRTAGMPEILSGVNSGELVIVEGTQNARFENGGSAAGSPNSTFQNSCPRRLTR